MPSTTLKPVSFLLNDTISDQVDVIMIHLLYTLPMLSKNFEINISDHRLITKENTFKRN